METSADFLERVLNFGDGWKIKDVEVRESQKELYIVSERKCVCS